MLSQKTDVAVRTSVVRPGRGAKLPGEGIDALILDAALRQALAFAQSLGRAGMRVAMAESFAEWDPSLPVAAFKSRWSACNATFANFADDPDVFAASVLEFVRRQPTAVVIPGSDGSIAALRPWRERLEAAGTRLALASDGALAVANDKDRTLELGVKLGIDIPRTALIERLEDTGSVLAEVGYPAVIKPTQSWVRRCGVERRLQARDVINESEALIAVSEMMTAGAAVVAQQWIPGRREGVIVFNAGGRIHATFAYIEHRTVPVLGGASVLRESIEMPADSLEASIALVETLGLEGYSVVEFRRDLAGRPVLMEINARLSGSVELAMRCGLDFPKMVWQWAMGEPIEPTTPYRTGVRMRWLHGDLRWLRESLSDPKRPDSLTRGKALRTFAADFFRPTYFDGFDLSDRRPILAHMAATMHVAHRSLDHKH
jgi:predicted ATP-grasp superfamily ATP-dependent carboligase